MRAIAAALLLILPAVAAAQESPADLMKTAKAHYDANRFKEALAAYEKARAAAEAAGDAVIAARAKLGLAGLKTLYGQFDDGIALAREAQATFEKAGDANGLAGAFLHMGNLHIGQGKFAVAADDYRQCAAVPESGRTAFCLERVGQCQESLGQYREAMATFREAIAAAIASKKPIVHAEALAGMADVYMNEGNTDLAVYYDQKAIEMFRELGSTAMVASTRNNLGVAYNLMGRGDRALECYRENLALMETLGYTRGINMSKMNIAAVLLRLGRHEEAAPVLRELLPAYEKTDDPDSRANVRRLLAESEERSGNLSAALDQAVKAAAEPTDGSKGIYLSRTLVGHLYRKLGRAEEARTALAGAIDAVESMHGHSTGDEVHFFDHRSEAYSEMALLMIGQGRVGDAFESAERYRSRVLIDVLRRAPDRPLALTDEERRRERELADRLSALHREAAHASSPELTERIAAARREHDAFQQELAAAHPRLRVERGTLPPVTARDAVSRLPAEAALVEFLVTEEKTYAFVIAGGAIEVRAIDVASDNLARRAESFRTLLADRRPDFRKPARELHEMLIAPIADLLSKRRSWILIPDGPLWNLPFQALLDRHGTYLAEKAAIVYAPSLAAWMEMSREAAAAPASGRRELLAFGNPTTPAGTDVERASRGKLTSLPEAEAEVKSAARYYGADSEVYVRGEATEERFKSEAPHFRVLHVAGHGVLNDASPMHSYLLLAQGRSKTEDGYLEAGELMQMDLGADLVVLSACDTARGAYAAGEGIIGFSWALFAARCRTQVVSQWKVDSAATSTLMRKFHQNIRHDRTQAASAMQKTIVSMLRTKEYRHPFYWAAFVVMGDGL
ncbi:MAG TPA: CHAT domain-containing tetratricopeptide repeat protein [Thermoanaerobaculia bacterium]|nr:CHAT domain-containing tetratricopeptide repeat protein [Thermoanaerobaculia bacterium]